MLCAPAACSLRMYNGLVERCFKDCVDSFRRKDLESSEEKVRMRHAHATGSYMLSPRHPDMHAAACAVRAAVLREVHEALCTSRHAICRAQQSSGAADGAAAAAATAWEAELGQSAQCKTGASVALACLCLHYILLLLTLKS